MRDMVTLLLAVLVVLVTLPPAPAAAETEPHAHRYVIRTRGRVTSDVDRFAAVVADTLADPRGWGQGGRLRWQQVDSGGELTIWLAAPATVPRFADICTRFFSCRVGRHVVINDARWAVGSPHWPGGLRAYRRYVINHEVGHWLGLGHAGCPGLGEPAPVMLQQSKGQDGCRARVWPLDAEVQSAGLPLAEPVPQRSRRRPARDDVDGAKDRRSLDRRPRTAGVYPT